MKKTLYHSNLFADDKSAMMIHNREIISYRLANVLDYSIM